LLGDQRLAVNPAVLDQRPLLGDYAGGRVIVGIRPESIEDAMLAPQPPRDRRLHGTAALLEALGPELSIHFTVPGARLAETQAIAELPRDTSTIGTHGGSGAVLIGRFNPHSGIREGGPVEAVVDTSDLHFFDPETGLGIYGRDKEGAEE
jgi:multiple sugar transport system ATP-binding protein